MHPILHVFQVPPKFPVSNQTNSNFSFAHNQSYPQYSLALYKNVHLLFLNMLNIGNICL